MKPKHRIKEQKRKVKPKAKKGINLVKEKIKAIASDVQILKSSDASLEIKTDSVNLVIDGLLHYEWDRLTEKLFIHFHAPQPPAKLGVTAGYQNVLCPDNCNTIVYYDMEDNRWFDLNGIAHTCPQKEEVGSAAEGQYATEVPTGEVEDTSSALKTGEWEKQS